MRRRLRSVPLLVAAALLAACVGREPARPGPEARGAPPAPPVPSDSPFSGERFTLMAAKLDLPPLPDPPALANAPALPDPPGQSTSQFGARADYFAELRRRIEEKWVYPQEAVLAGRSGAGQVRFLLRSDGSVYVVEIVRSSGVKLLDHHIEQAIRSAQPFPPFPSSEPDLFTEDPMPVTIDFNYKLHPRR